MAVIYFPPLQYVFQTEALSAYGSTIASIDERVTRFPLDLLYLTCLSSSVFLVNEIRKLIERVLRKQDDNHKGLANDQWII